jgi:hypothetical protein
MKQGMLCLLALHLALIPCFADVIPSRRAEKNEAAEQTLKSRLQQVGMSETDAQRHLGDLTSRETAFFADNPDRIQVAGSLYWYEWVGGIAVLVAAVITYIALDVHWK